MPDPQDDHAQPATAPAAPAAADPIAAASAAIATAATLVAASQALVSEAHDRFVAVPGLLTPEQFAKVVNHHATIAAQAAMIRLTAAINIGGGVQADLDRLTAATGALDQRLASLAKAQDVIGKVSQVLVTAGSLLTFVVAPSVATLDAVVTAVIELAQ